jgi:hypothetical protein
MAPGELWRRLHCVIRVSAFRAADVASQQSIACRATRPSVAVEYRWNWRRMQLLYSFFCCGPEDAVALRAARCCRRVPCNRQLWNGERPGRCSPINRLVCYGIWQNSKSFISSMRQQQQQLEWSISTARRCYTSWRGSHLNGVYIVQPCMSNRVDTTGCTM